ncbi:hypothetical protein [Acinetobacter sp. BSP-28]|uniref:hypothetical protein n=1 Tax=Acinetobacter sp. BSP-28 TaxID=3344661 RepID=UPI0037700D91
MSNYRDDVQETLFISDFSFAKVRSGDADQMRITDTVISKIINRLDDSLVISDQAINATLLLLEDRVQISDSYTEVITAKALIVDAVKIKDTSFAKYKTNLEDSIVIADELRSTIKVLHQDSLQISEQYTGKNTATNIIHDSLKARDQVSNYKTANSLIIDSLSIHDTVNDTLKNIITERLVLSDEVQSFKQSSQLINDKLKAQDSSFIKFADLVHDQVVISDSIKTVNRFNDLIQDSLILSDVFIELSQPIDLIQDSLTIKDEGSGFKKAKGQINDTLFIDDESIDNHDSHIAWSSSDSWDMSRYDAFNYEQLVVIDGRLYGVTASGIESLDYGHAEIAARVEMPKIDIGKGNLAHPLGMYMEYTLEGQSKAFTVDVGTTQSGNYQQYQYALPAEQSGQLTNGRVLFGRGLRGRHFNFTINMLGKFGYINDLSIDIAQTKRRV